MTGAILGHGVPGSGFATDNDGICAGHRRGSGLRAGNRFAIPHNGTLEGF
jgi:hypothetical protein